MDNSSDANAPGAGAVEGVAEHYANELDAQFRTLNDFVGHGGEIGRAHEYYLRGVLSRFLPDNLRLGSGFIASPVWTSRQQDILIYRRDYTTLFQVGDCVVLDYEAVVGTVEVKTDLNSMDKYVQTLESISELEGRYHNRELRALYAWDGISLDKALGAIRKFLEADQTKNRSRLPHATYVRGKYLLIAQEDREMDQSPFSLWRIGSGGITEVRRCSASFALFGPSVSPI